MHVQPSGNDATLLERLSEGLFFTDDFLSEAARFNAGLGVAGASTAGAALVAARRVGTVLLRPIRADFVGDATHVCGGASSNLASFSCARVRLRVAGIAANKRSWLRNWAPGMERTEATAALSSGERHACTVAAGHRQRRPSATFTRRTLNAAVVPV